MDKISLGKSSVDTTYFYGGVTGGGAYGPGICEKVVGISASGKLTVKRLPFHDNRSGSKRSGSLDYELTGDGVYRAYAYADSNRSEGPEFFFELEGYALKELNRQELDERLRALSPDSFAIAEHAQRKVARRRELLPVVQAEVHDFAAAGERLEVTKVDVDDQLQLSRLTVTRYQSCGHFDEISVNTMNQLITHLSAPSLPCTYCEAHAEKMRAADETIKRLQDTASAKNLPTLSGSPRQIKWALEIRDNFWQKNPGNPLLKRATTAKYWIENRESLK
ncbi:hypothetical protein [Cupriavidus sp. TMH.W2]|uniref:hypothetical protein n=1 Tax=Cupriavidus sp. TMH.W2 TaxID=3434465 RepID=UPI003D78410A